MTSQGTLVVEQPGKTRHSVDRDVKSFCGWETLDKIIEASKTVGPNSLLNAGFIGALFETGGRVSEVRQMKPSMFSVYKGCQPRLVMVKNMLLLKRYKKIEGYKDEKGKNRYKTEKINAVRDFSFRADEPLVKPLINWAIYAVENRYEWLFPSPWNHAKPISWIWAYLMVSQTGDKLGMELWPHWFRAMRASQLATEYEFREGSILEWFEWENWETAKKYTKLGPLGLAKRMGVTFRKDRGLKPSELEFQL